MSGTHCRYYWAAWGALPLLAGLMLLSVAKGSVPLSLTQVLGALRLLDVPVSEMIGRIVIDLRVPRTLLAANPDFFFAGWNYGMKVGGEVTPSVLDKYGIKTFVLSESCVFTASQKQKASMDLLYNDELTLGKIFGKEPEARTLVDGWKKTLNALPKPPQGVQPLKVFVYDSGEDKPFTSGRYAMPTAIIEAAGGKNVMDDLEMSWGTTSWESVATAEPDFIILLDYQTGSGADSLRRFLENHPLMKQTPAVKQQRYLKLQYAELTPGPANINAAEKLAHALYPAANQ